MKLFRICLPALAVFGMAAMPVRSHAQLPVEEIALKLLGDRFGIAPEQISGFLGRSNVNVFDAAPYYSTSYHTERPVDEVWRLRQEGLGWGQIAHRLGMHPGTFNKLRKSGAFDRDEIWEDICEDRYGLRESEFNAIRRRGGTIRDALPAAIIARASHTRPLTVYQRYRSVRDWNRTAGLYKTDLRSHHKYARQNVKPAKAPRVQVSKARGKAVGKGRAHRVMGKSRPVSGVRAKHTPKRSGGAMKAVANSHSKAAGKAHGAGKGHSAGKGGGVGHGHGGGKKDK